MLGVSGDRVPYEVHSLTSLPVFVAGGSSFIALPLPSLMMLMCTKLLSAGLWDGSFCQKCENRFHVDINKIASDDKAREPIVLQRKKNLDGIPPRPQFQC